MQSVSLAGRKKGEGRFSSKYFQCGGVVMDFFSSLGDDELALLGCTGALLLCGTLMSLSYFIGKKLNPTADEEPQTLTLRTTSEQTNPESKQKAA